MTKTQTYRLPEGFRPSALLDFPLRQTAIEQSSTGNGQVSIANNASLPKLAPDSFLVKVVAVSVNPCDWKMPSKFPAANARVGCDFAGEVLAIGPVAAKIHPNIQIGDRICGGVHGNNPIDIESGSFAQYVAAHADLCFELPPRCVWEEGAVLGGSVIATLQIALYNSLGLSYTPENACTESNPPHVLVYGAGTSTGATALQILRMSGYRPIATCSPRNFDLARKAGAEDVFDYHDPECASKIKAYTEGKLHAVLDVITDATSQSICHAAIGRKGGRYTCLEKPSDAFHQRKNTITVNMVVGLAASGKEIALDGGYERKANPQLRSDAAGLFRQIQKKLNMGTFHPHPARVIGHGFEEIIRGMAMLKNKETSGEKLVVFVEAQT